MPSEGANVKNDLRSISILKWSAMFLIMFALLTILNSLVHAALWKWFVARLR